MSQGDAELFVVNKILSVSCMKKLFNAAFKMESQNAGWIYIGRERELNKLYIKTEQLQEEE